MLLQPPYRLAPHPPEAFAPQSRAGASRACPSRLIVAHADSRYATAVYRYFHRLWWEVHLAATGSQARRLAHGRKPAVVVLDTELCDETGWLTCSKLVREHPEHRVVLVCPDPTMESYRFASFVGAAAMVAHGLGVEALIEQVLATA